MKKSSLFGAGLAALVLVSGCKARDIELSSDLSDISETNTDKAFIAAYSSDGGAEGTAAAADIIEKRLKAVCDGDFTVSADGSSITIELPDKTDSEAEELLKDIDKTALLTFRMGWSGDIPEGGSYEDLELLKKLGRNRLNVTIGSALDLFGGALSWEKVSEMCKSD